MMKFLAAIIFVFIFASISSAYKVVASTGYTAHYQHSVDLELVEKAVEYAHLFFEKHGYETRKYSVNIIFKNEVLVDLGDTSIRVYGYFDRINAGDIYITSFNDPWIAERKSFGQDVTKELHRSIITHEVVHALLEKVSGGIDGHGVHEYMAYSAQIWSLPNDIQDIILSEYNITSGFRFEANINAMKHGFNPHRFGAEAFMDYKLSNGDLIDGIIDGSVNPDRDYNFNNL